MPSSVSSSCIGSSRKMRASMRLGSRTIGVNSMCARMSRSTSMPGATSISSMPSRPRRKTQRSVTYSTGCPHSAAYAPLNVICSTCFTNFRARPSRTIDSVAVLDLDLEPAGGERAREDDTLRVLADVDEAAGAGKARAEAADVDVAFRVDLRHAEARHVESAAVVEVELLVLVDHGVAY